MPPVSFQQHRCVCCQKLIVKSTHVTQKDEAEFFRTDLKSDKIVFDFTLKDLKSGEDKGCALCKWILKSEAISRHGYLDSRLASFDPDSAFSVSTYEALCFVIDKHADHRRPSLTQAASEGGDAADNYVLIAKTSPPFKIGIGYMSDVRQIDYFGLWDPISKTVKCLTLRGLQCFAEPDDPMARDISTRPVESNPESSLPIIKSWLAECQSSHTECQSMSKSLGRPGEKPARLLRIDSFGRETRLCIQETEKLPELPQYVALSYCWGGDQPVKCTTDTMSRFMTSIPIKTLPQTLKDAIKVCLELGYCYLWIDALCIIQNNNVDKTSEIAKMPFIYGNAAFTVAASRASSVTNGFLHTRTLDSDTRAAFALPCICSNGETGTLNIIDVGTGPEPIDDRGWTFQERLLSTRIVEFGSRQTRWTCREESYWDGVTDGWRPTAERSSTKPNTSVLRVALSKPESIQIDLWYHLVDIYTERKLTHVTDRPLAVSGVAEWFGSLIRDEYIAGIWKSHIHTGLLWAVQAKDRRRRPLKFEGPSWSWFSVSSPVWFHYIYYQSWPEENLKIKLLSTSIALKNSNAPFGAICEGSGLLELEGKLALAKVTRLNDQTPIGNESGSNDHEVEIFGQGQQGPFSGVAVFYPDSEEVVDMFEEKHIDTVALEIVNMQQGPTWSSYGLILQRLDVGFSRLGTFVFDVDDGNCQQDEESDTEWEERIENELNWFKNLRSTTIILK